MFQTLASGLLLAALSLSITPANATPSRAAEAFDSSVKQDGGCYETRNDSLVCYQSVGKGIYTASLVDPKESKYPTTFYIDCNRTDAWEAYGIITQQNGRAFSTAFCKDRA